MRISRIYCDQPIKKNQDLILNGDASHYVVNVLRLKKGAELTIFNGTGGEYSAELAVASKRKAVVRIKKFSRKDIESPIKIHLLQGISRGDKMDYTIQKAVELGVHKITPVFTEFCNVKLKPEKLSKKQQHWQQIVISACEQCGRNYIPEVVAPMNLLQALVSVKSGQKLILSLLARAGLSVIEQKKGNVTILIGPEGGFSNTEVQLAQTHKFTPILLGPRTLRTETAALAAISAVQTMWGDFA